MKKFSFALLALALCACASEQPVADCPAPTESKVEEIKPATAASASFPSELLATAQRSGEVQELRVYYGKDQRPRKIAVYHQRAELVPEPVKAAALAQFPDAKIVKYEHEYYADIGVVHEVELETTDGKDVEVSAFADGTVYYVEQPVELESLAESAREIIAQKVPGGVIEELEHKKGPELELYQARVAPEGGGAAKHYLVFDAAGNLVRHNLRYPAYIEVPVN